MKKLFSALMLGVMLTFNCIGVYAATETTEVSQETSTSISISTASYDTTTKTVNVSGTVTNPVESQILTVMSTGIKETSSYDLEAVVFIDQNENVTFDKNGSFNLSFALSDSAVEGSRYLVRIGGSEIDSPAFMAFTFTATKPDDPDNPNPPTPTIIYGDVNNDGSVTSADAALLLQYVLNPDSCEITTEGLANAQIKLTPIKNFTAAEAAMILRKALDTSGFMLPAETK